MLPYVSGSYGRRALAAKATSEDGDSFDAVISGKMFAVGAGVERSFSPTMAVDAGVDVGFGKLDHFKAGDEKWDADVNATRSVRLRLGITWRPGSKR
jgi:hypothetical protein